MCSSFNLGIGRHVVDIIRAFRESCSLRSASSQARRLRSAYGMGCVSLWARALGVGLQSYNASGIGSKSSRPDSAAARRGRL